MEDDEEFYLQQVLKCGSDAPGVELKLSLLRKLRRSSAETAAEADKCLLARLERQHSGLAEAREAQEQLRELLEKLTAPPWHPAVVLRCVQTRMGPGVVVQCNGSRRVVGLADEVETGQLRPGDQVLLSHEQNVVMAPAPEGLTSAGETAVFERRTPDGRLVLNWRDDTVVVRPAAVLDEARLERGALVRWDRHAWMAYEELERADDTELFLEDDPEVGPEQVGGQDENLQRLLSALTTTLVAPETARRYGLEASRSILMWGPPGCGKTLMARVAASEVARVSGRECRFAVVKPSEWENPYVGATQQNIRACFAALRKAAEDSLVVLFMDEVEAVGRIRGGMASHHSDKFLAALLAELDGFTELKGVTVIGASNRKDLIDPALLERISQMEVRVDRPDMQGARDILRIHLPANVPYNPDGKAAEQTREKLIETAVSRLYSPNAANELARLRFRDNTQRPVAARELVSGRLLEQICREARNRAFLREAGGREGGVSVDDMEAAVGRALRRLASTLTVRNARAYLTGLPQDLDVVAVEPIRRRVRRPHRYLNPPDA